MAAIAGVSLTTPRIVAKASDSPKLPSLKSPSLNYPWKKSVGFGFGSGRMHVIRPIAAAPESLSEKVETSIKAAEETCAGDPASGECVAAWDEVEELSAAASHAKDKSKKTDALEEYCKDNMDEAECRTYED